MRIKMRTLAAGPKGVLYPDNVYDSGDVDDRAAQALIDGGFAELVPEKRKPESAAIAAPENAALPRAKAK